MNIHLAQLIVERTAERNLAKIQDVLATVQAGEWVVFPEAMLSGYFPEEHDYITRLNPDMIERSVAAIHDLVHARGCHCLLGSARRSPAGWQNVGMLLRAHGPAGVYAKLQLSPLDVRHFRPGPNLPVFDVKGVRVGMQLCRDLLFPQQWSVLRQAGADCLSPEQRDQTARRDLAARLDRGHWSRRCSCAASTTPRPHNN